MFDEATEQDLEHQQVLVSVEYGQPGPRATDIWREAAHLIISGPRANCLTRDLLHQGPVQRRRGSAQFKRFAGECQVEQLACRAEERSDVGDDARVDAGQVDHNQRAHW